MTKSMKRVIGNFLKETQSTFSSGVEMALLMVLFGQNLFFVAAIAYLLRNSTSTSILGGGGGGVGPR